MTSLSNEDVQKHFKTSKNTKALQKQYEKQRRRKLPTGTLPSAALDIPLDQYTSFVACLRSSQRVLALLGAGLSASSGIPTFRGAGGLWRDHDATKLATPEAFEKDPNLVWQFHRHRRHAASSAKPNRGHLALAKLAERKDFLAINQNIDGLSQRAHHPSSALVPIHGSLFDDKCSNRGCTFSSADDVTDSTVTPHKLPNDHAVPSASNAVASTATETLPQCSQCTSLLRPAVVWFGEQIPSAARDRIHQWLDIGPLDLMLVVGTSATVWPAVFYIHSARVAGARVAVFNTEEPESEVDDESLRLTDKDWSFKGDAAATLPDLLKEVVGRIPETKD
ncbi:MAG: hypothetical protein Q9222_003798 [Ikaeria aurantiellina]